MNINILRYSLFGIAGGQEVDRNFSQSILLIIFCVLKNVNNFKSYALDNLTTK